MAYALRYYKEIEHADGKVIRLEIHKKDSTAGAIEIGAVVQGLSLQIQGQQGDIDTPIVKTSLSMTFVDAQDIEDGRKNGFWEEFYTPDSVLWKIIVKAKDAQGASFRTIWGGYVTPDSFTEDLVYRGSVNIIARDNIGHMQDFPFDAEGDADGMISLYDLVSMAWAKIDSPMSLDWRGEEDCILWMNTSERIPAFDTLMNVSAFEDMNWYQALEKALYSYGVVMRYAGNNRVVVCPLRSMPDYGIEAGNIGHLVPQFITGATRELVPAVKRIEESVDYDMVQSLPMPHLKAQDFDGSTNSYRCKIEGVDMGYGSFGTAEHDAPVWPIINGDKGWSNVPSSTLYFSPYAYELGYFSERRDLGEELLRYTYIAANNVDNRLVTFKKSVTCSDFTIKMRFGQPWGLNNQGRLEQQSVFNLWRIYYSIMIDQNGIQEYYDKDRGWRPTYRELSVVYDPTQENFDFEAFVAMGEHTGMADIYFVITKIEYAQTSLGSLHKTGLYAQVQELSFNSSESSSLLEKNTVNTNYKAENNVVISRDPEFGPAYNTVALPGFIKNGIFYREGGVIMPAKKWAFGRAGDQQMAVYNHLQLLAYYAKPNNLISGTIVNGDVTRVACIYDWHGAEHMLVSGTYNLLNGHIESAVLREFARYEEMWSDVAGADMPDTEQESRSNMEGGGASGGGASSTYTNTTDVNVGGGGGGTGASYLNDLLDVDTTGVVAQSVLYFNGTSWVDMSLATLLNPYVKAEAFNPVKAWFDKLGMLVVEEDGNVVVKTNLTIEGDMVSSGEGENTGGGGSVIGGIMVNGMPYTDDDGDGFITLPDYPKKLSALENDLNLGSFAYKNALAWKEVSDVMSSNEFNFIPDGFSGNVNINYRTIDKKATGSISNYLFRDGSNSGGYASLRAKSFIVNGGTSSQFLKADGSVDSTSYLPLTGGTMTGNLTLPTLVFNSGMYLDTSGAKDLVVYDNTSRRIVIHSGNVGEYACKAININSDITDTDKAYEGAKLSAWTNWGKSTNNPSGAAYASGLTISYAGNAFQIAKDAYDLGKLYVRMSNYKSDNIPSWSDWKIIAFTDSNVASATKLATARTIWGQSFDGTGDILTSSVATMRYVSFRNLADDGQAGYIGRGNSSGDEIILYSNSFLRFYAGAAERMRINSSGNVGIGTTSPSSKLSVFSNAASALPSLGALSTNYTIEFGHAGKYGTYLGTLGSGNGFIQQGRSDGTATAYNLMLNPLGGNVGIGTTDPQYKLDVNGTIASRATDTSIRGIYAENSSGGVSLYVAASGNRGLYDATNNKWVMYTNGTNAIFPVGNIGIGISSPAYKLDVAGTGRFTGKVSANGGIDIPNGQQLAFLDASGNRHTIKWDSELNGILIDGNLIVLGEFVSGRPPIEIEPSVPEISI